MAAEPGLDGGVQLGDPPVEVGHLLGQAGDQVGGDVLAGRRAVCAFAADRLRALVTRQPYHPGAWVGGAGRPFQRGADRGQVLAQSVESAGAGGHQVRTAGGEHPQLDHELVGGAQLGQIASHPGLVGDDTGVLGVGPALAAVASRGAADRLAGQVAHRLAVFPQHGQRQSRLHGGQVHRPLRLVGAQAGHFAQQCQQIGLVVGHSPGQQTASLGVQHTGPVVFLADIHPDPHRVQPILPLAR